jgi:ribonuclease BN (tRNA processing enzyme)
VEIILLPSSVSLGTEEPCQFLTSYLVNETIAVDAGSVGFLSPVAKQKKVRHILISHTHMDHIASLPLFLENVGPFDGEPVTIHGNQEVLDCLRCDLFNGRVWPDFIALSESKLKFLKLATLEPGRTIHLEGLRITPVMVDHLVPTLGFLLEDGNDTVVISSDTGPTTALWELVNEAPNLRAVFLEVCFPDAMAPLAAISHHLTPATFAGEVRKLTRQVPVLAVHIKALWRDQVLAELAALGLSQVAVARPGQAYHFGESVRASLDVARAAM